MPEKFKLVPVGTVHRDENGARIEIFEPYRDAMLGLEGFSHVYVLYWFHENDHPEGRNFLQVHPRRDPDNPLTGVFATHSPLRPNLIAMTLCHILSIDNLTIFLEDIDARDGSPVLDIKCYIPGSEKDAEIRLPSWV